MASGDHFITIIHIYVTLYPIYESLLVIFALVIHMSAPGLDVRVPQKMKYVYFFNIWDFNLKSSYHIVSLCDTYIDTGESIAWKQDGPILINKGP